MDLEIEGVAQAPDPTDCLGELIGSTEAHGCAELLDPYADTELGQPQLALLARELTVAAARVTPELLRRARRDQVAQAIAVGWQPTVIEELQRRASVRDDELVKRVTQIRQHVETVIALLTSAAERNVSIRFIGD